MCNECLQDKEFSAFYKSTKASDGLQHKCKECQKEVMRKHRASEEQREYRISYYNENFERIREYGRLYKKSLLIKDGPKWRIIHKMRLRVFRALTSKKPSKNRIIKTIGCTPYFLKQYIESKFSKGMKWTNRHRWHIDHIIPISSFDLSLTEEQEKCFHYTNMQPLWSTDNILKSNKILTTS